MTVRTGTGALAVLHSHLMAPETLPGHRVLSFTLLNGSPRPVELLASDVEVLAPDGHVRHGAVSFDRPGHHKHVQLGPGETLTVVAAWHGEAARVVYPDGTLEL